MTTPIDTASADRAASPLPEPLTAWDRVLHAFLVDYFEAMPIHGTAAGYHLVDDRWPDLSEAGRVGRLDSYARHQAAVAGLRDTELSAAERVDRAILDEMLEKLRFGDEVLREDAWDPLSIVYLAGSGLFGILSRDYAPWSERGAAFAARVEGLPRLLADSLAGLTGLPDRPVSVLHLETALAQLSG